MNHLAESYKACQFIARSSGSNFYRAFEFLRLDRRQAMTALYAFSRLADDATDGALDSQTPWDLDAWLGWIDRLELDPQTTHLNMDPPCERLGMLRAAIVDSMQRFRIPKDTLKQILYGVDQDTRPLQIDRYEQLQSYMFRVASAVGLCCLAIWSEKGEPEPSSQAYLAAVHCGHAFQLTNILRDLVEDAQRGRMYLAQEDLNRAGFDRESLIEALKIQNASNRIEKITKMGDWNGLMRLYSQRATACYTSGWGVSRYVAPDSLRMFSMIWSTYHGIFTKIQLDPHAALQKRPSLSLSEKLRLYAGHAFTPFFRSIKRPEARRFFQTEIQAEGKPKVAVIGGGLAGIQSAMHLAKHGCDTWLFESRSRLGGRVGSFIDPASEQSVDYCQHVGMKCCKELLRWIKDIGQENHWQEQSTLHFRSQNGKPFRVAAWPLPAPFHLAGLILQWPGLRLGDRVTVAWGLSRLMRAKPTQEFQEQMAVDWLSLNHQSESSIASFWNTILVSALGEQLPRITMGSVHKVMIDGFAATKDAYHLLVPQRSLSELVHRSAEDNLLKLGVHFIDGATVTNLARTDRNTWGVQARCIGREVPDLPEFQAVVVAVPWHRVGALLANPSIPMTVDLKSRIKDVEKLESAPITGVHTWWSKPWLAQPHAILINRLSQWIFPGPCESVEAASSAPGEHYYQVVISGSRDLPKGDQDEILRRVERDLREAIPELEKSGAVMTRGKAITDPQSVFSVNAGHARGRLSTDLLGDCGLFLAGDWTATGWPATMEGALRSGSLSASCVLSYVGRPADVSLDGS